MKQSLPRRRGSRLSGFTLLELLVVIGIIAILAGVLLSAGSMALKAALRTKAANLANQIQTGAYGYYTEYSVYPVPTGTTLDYTIGDSTAANGASWASLLYCLSGNISPSTGLTTPTPATLIANTRAIHFLNLKTSDVYPSGSAIGVQDAPVNPLPSGTSIYFNIAIDSDYDGILGTIAPTSTVMPNFATGTSTSLTLSGGTSTAGVAVWANCTTKSPSTSCNANWWVHTY